MASPTMNTLPYIALQPSASSVFEEIADPNSDNAVEDVWISFYRNGEEEATKSLHGKIRVSESDEPGGVEAKVRDGNLEVELLSSSKLLVSCDPLSIPRTSLILPSPFANVPTKGPSNSEEVPAPSFFSLPSGRDGIHCFSVSSDQRRVVIGSGAGECRVIEVVRIQEDSQRIKKGKEVALRGHAGDITSAEFFPSNEVILTASTDMTLRVFSALDGSSPRQLRGHTKRVTGTHILTGGQHHGREVLSSSLDGNIKLWDLSTGGNTRTWRLPNPITALCVVSLRPSTGTNVLEGRFALCGHQNGTISMLSLSSPDPSPIIATFKISSPTFIETLSYNENSRLLAAGSRTGTVSLFRIPFDIQETSTEVEALSSWRRTEGSSITSVCWSTVGGKLALLVGGSDGLPYRVGIEVEESTGSTALRVLDEMVGLNCDSCTGISVEGEGRIWLSGGRGDGTLRVYDM